MAAAGARTTTPRGDHDIPARYTSGAGAPGDPPGRADRYEQALRIAVGTRF